MLPTPRGLLAAALLLAAHGAAAPPSVDGCSALVRREPRSLASYRCFWDLAHTGQRLPAERALEAILRRQPDNPGALMFLGLCRDERGLDARELLERAVAGFQRAGDAESEGYARLSLFALECLVGRRCDEYRDQLDRAEDLAAEHGLADLRSLSTIWRARDALAQDDVGAAERYLHAADASIGPAGPAWLRRWVLDQRGVLYLLAGRYAEALENYRALAALTEGWPAPHAMALGAMASASVELAQRGELERSQAERTVREALAAEEASGVELWSRYSGSFSTRVLLAFLLGPTEAAIDDLERLELANARRRSNYPFPVLWLLARYSLDGSRPDGRAALRHADEALALCIKPSHDWERAHGLLVRGDVLWRSGERERGLADARAALASFERLRGRQPEAAVRARYGASTAFAHQLVAGWLLDPARSPAPDVEAAFEVMERLRARVLFESLLAARDRSELPAALHERGVELHERISRLQRRLLDPGLGPERGEVRQALGRAETEEASWRDEAARALPRFRSVDVTPPRLADVQAAMRPDEAMLLFQTWWREPTPEAPYDDGSSWVLAVTRQGVAAHRIPDGDRLEPQVEQWQALLERRDGSERPGAARLFRELLRAPLSGLPPGVTRLVLVPDGPLHGLAVDALRAEERGAPLAERYATSVAPSASLWLRWRTSGPPARRGPLLALADPSGLGRGSGAGVADAWRAEGAALVPLPGARSEARTAVAAGAPGSRLLVGPEASEHFLKSADLRSYDVLHFATHAVVDEDAPERSAVVLAPGAEVEDGLLQSREITQLDLAGKAVVLAACRGASGQGLRGEGVIGLGRSFFEAGAHAVVGSLWPLRDDESSALLETFYRRLGDGAPMADALAEARRERIRAGAPPAAWAGMVLLGDGALQPIPESVGRARRTRARVLTLAAAGGALALLLSLGALGWRRSRAGR